MSINFLNKTYTIILLLFSIGNFSCEKVATDKMTLEGYVRTHGTNDPIGNIIISVDAIKPGEGMGIITSGKRERLGQTTTNASGYYKFNLKIFEQAERLSFKINDNLQNAGYHGNFFDRDLSQFNRNGKNNFDFILSKTELLTVHFKNALPVSDEDYFQYTCVDWGTGYSKFDKVKTVNCGTVKLNEAYRWVGKDVCGIETIETSADAYTVVHWFVIKNGIEKSFKDSVFVKEGIPNDFFINY